MNKYYKGTKRSDHEILHDTILKATDGRSDSEFNEFTHRSLDNIAHDLNLNSFERLILWLAKTDLYALSVCTYQARLTLNALGLMVIFTSLLAMLSCFIALSTVIDPKIELKPFIVLIGAAIYGFGIMLIDREIVGASDKKSLWIRIMFAIMIALVVSWPIKVKLLEGPIKIEIGNMIEEQNVDKLKRIETLKGNAKLGIDHEVEQINKTIESERKTIDDLQKEISREQTDQSRGQICGSRCLARKAELIVSNDQLKRLLGELNTITGKDGLSESSIVEINRLQKEIDKQKDDAHDFLSLWQAQARVMKKDQSGANLLSLILFGFFLALELVPVGLKMALGTTEYQQYIEARHRLNLQKIAQATNIMLEEIQKAKTLEELMQMRPELTDYLAYLMEDSTVQSDMDQQLTRERGIRTEQQNESDNTNSSIDTGASPVNPPSRPVF